MAPPNDVKKESEANVSPMAILTTALVFAIIFGLSFFLTHLDPVRLLVSRVPVVVRSRCPVPAPDLHYPTPRTFHRGECECNAVRLFAILSMQRSGSGWFETFLNNHTNVSSNGEIFSVKERRSNVSAVFATLDRLYNLDWMSSAAKNECLAAVGFKWMLNQGSLAFHEDVVEYFNRRGVSVIFLLRRNLLHRLISILANTHDQNMKQINGTHKSHVHSEKEVSEEIFSSFARDSMRLEVSKEIFISLATGSKSH